jgi:hypothetical protein
LPVFRWGAELAAATEQVPEPEPEPVPVPEQARVPEPVSE